jgi:hypothetical protein
MLTISPENESGHFSSQFLQATHIDYVGQVFGPFDQAGDPGPNQPKAPAVGIAFNAMTGIGGICQHLPRPAGICNNRIENSGG